MILVVSNCNLGIPKSTKDNYLHMTFQSTFENDVSFPKVGYVSFWDGNWTLDATLQVKTISLDAIFACSRCQKCQPVLADKLRNGQGIA